ncbi:MAG: hypothetical protein FWE36_03160 [Erysipelotrichales bacterium]|nr:hypothetical protein [Erysipelotrichales bacterium]
MTKYLKLLDTQIALISSNQSNSNFAQFKKNLTNNYYQYQKNCDSVKEKMANNIINKTKADNKNMQEFEAYLEIITSNINNLKIIAKSLSNNIEIKKSFAHIELDQQYNDQLLKLQERKKHFEAIVTEKHAQLIKQKNNLELAFANKLLPFFNQEQSAYDTYLSRLNLKYFFLLSQEADIINAYTKNSDAERKEKYATLNSQLRVQQKIYSDKVLNHNQSIRENKDKLHEQFIKIDKILSADIDLLDKNQNFMLQTVNAKKNVLDLSNKQKIDDLEEKIRQLRNEKARLLAESQNILVQTKSFQKQAKTSDDTLENLNLLLLNEKKRYQLEKDILKIETENIDYTYTKKREYRYFLAEYTKNLQKLNMHQVDSEGESIILQAKNEKERRDYLNTYKYEYHLKLSALNRAAFIKNTQNHYLKLRLDISEKKNEYLTAIEKHSIILFKEAEKNRLIKEYHQTKSELLTNLENLKWERELNIVNNDTLANKEEKLIRTNNIDSEFELSQQLINLRYNNAISVDNGLLDEIKINLEYSLNEIEFEHNKANFDFSAMLTDYEFAHFLKNCELFLSYLDKLTHKNSSTKIYNFFIFLANNLLKELILTNTTKANEINFLKLRPIIEEINLRHKNQKSLIVERKAEETAYFENMQFDLNQLLYTDSLIRSEVKDLKERISTYERLNVFNRKNFFSESERQELLYFNDKKIKELTPLLTKKSQMLKDQVQLISEQEREIEIQKQILLQISKEEKDIQEIHEKEILRIEKQKRKNGLIYYEGISRLKETFKANFIYYKEIINNIRKDNNPLIYKNQLIDIYREFQKSLVEGAKEVISYIKINEVEHTEIIYNRIKASCLKNLTTLKKLATYNQDLFLKRSQNIYDKSFKQKSLLLQKFKETERLKNYNLKTIDHSFKQHEQDTRTRLKGLTSSLITRILQIEYNKRDFNDFKLKKAEKVSKPVKVSKISNYSPSEIIFNAQSQSIKSSLRQKKRELNKKIKKEKEELAGKAILLHNHLRQTAKNHKREIRYLEQEIKKIS